MEALDKLKSVICDPDGKVSMNGSAEDLRVAQEAIDSIANADPTPQSSEHAHPMTLREIMCAEEKDPGGEGIAVLNKQLVASLEKQTELRKQLDALTAGNTKPTTDHVRYCPECGCVGVVPPGRRDCCPDGIRAVYVPRIVAEKMLALGLYDKHMREKLEAAQKDVRRLDDLDALIVAGDISIEREPKSSEFQIYTDTTGYDNPFTGATLREVIDAATAAQKEAGL